MLSACHFFFEAPNSHRYCQTDCANPVNFFVERDRSRKGHERSHKRMNNNKNAWHCQPLTTTLTTNMMLIIIRRTPTPMDCRFCGYYKCSIIWNWTKNGFLLRRGQTLNEFFYQHSFCLRFIPSKHCDGLQQAIKIHNWCLPIVQISPYDFGDFIIIAPSRSISVSFF